jgi:hypothetical protein
MRARSLEVKENRMEQNLPSILEVQENQAPLYNFKELELFYDHSEQSCYTEHKLRYIQGVSHVSPLEEE